MEIKITREYIDKLKDLVQYIKDNYNGDDKEEVIKGREEAIEHLEELYKKQQETSSDS